MADAPGSQLATARTLCEHSSKELLAGYGVPLAREAVAETADAAVRAADDLGYPVVVKLCGPGIAHKTERGLVRLDLPDAPAVRAASEDLLAGRRPEDRDAHLLVAERVRGYRELIAGLFRDPQFGACVMLGLFGILAEALRDSAFAVAPLDRAQARRMIHSLRARDLIAKPFRGEPALDEDALADVLVGLGRLGLERADVESVDVNPLIVCGARPVAVDALVELGSDTHRVPRVATALGTHGTARVLERFRPLFHPRGIVIAGVSSHPGKFGFVAFHNLLRFGYRGELFPLNREGVEILGRPTLRDASRVPEGRADLIFVCTPNQVNVELLRACAKVGVRAAFVASGGYGEAGADGRARERELVAAADELGILLAGPNGQGVISTSARRARTARCALG